MNMNCPYCGGPLRQVSTSVGHIDACARCRGVWFDAGELGPFATKLSQAEGVKPEMAQLFKKRDVKSLGHVTEGHKLCPRCILYLICCI